MTSIKMEKYEWINPENHSIAVDDQKQPVLNENGDLIVLDNESGKCIAVPNTDDVLEIFGFGYSAGYVSPSVSPKESSDHDMKPLVQVVTDADQLLWSMRTPCQKDIEATREMLALVASKKYQDMFNDQCTVKIRVWKRICEELMSKGYRIADSVNEGGIKCHQKWRNLEKSYRNYLISSADLNSSAPKKPPPYFEALHEILRRKKKYANAVTYTQTVVVSDDMMMDPDTSIGSSVSSNHHHHHHHQQHNNQQHHSHHNQQPQQTQQQHLNDTDPIEELIDDVDGPNDDHCYVVNSSGHVSKRFKMDPLTVCSATGGVSDGIVVSGGGSNGMVVGGGGSNGMVVGGGGGSNGMVVGGGGSNGIVVSGGGGGGGSNEVVIGGNGPSSSSRGTRNIVVHQQQQQPHPPPPQQQQQQQQQHHQQQHQHQLQQQHQQPDTLEQILAQMVRVHKQSLNMQEEHFTRIEKLLNENALQAMRLADVMAQLLQSSRADDNKSMTGGNSSDIE